MIKIRQAAPQDVAPIFALIQHNAEQQAMLPRTAEDIRQSLGDFLVAEEKGRLLGCGALKLYNRTVAEIRSLCVTPGIKRRGVGRALTVRLLREAEQLGLRTVFALTLAPEFFIKCGFRLTAGENFPMKIAHDCLSCALYLRCQEKTVAIRIPLGQAEEAGFAEPAAVLA